MGLLKSVEPTQHGTWSGRVERDDVNDTLMYVQFPDRVSSFEDAIMELDRLCAKRPCYRSAQWNPSARKGGEQ